MLKVLATIAAAGIRQAAAGRAVTPRHDNNNRDNNNRAVFRSSGAMRRRAIRPVLACSWWPTGPRGRLECRWSIESAEGTGTGAESMTGGQRPTVSNRGLRARGQRKQRAPAALRGPHRRPTRAIL
jgi:hypothetical protein